MHTWFEEKGAITKNNYMNEAKNLKKCNTSKLKQYTKWIFQSNLKPQQLNIKLCFSSCQSYIILYIFFLMECVN